MRNYQVICLAWGLALAGCQANSSSEQKSQTFEDSWTEVMPQNHGKVTVNPSYLVSGKEGKRLSVEHLRKSIGALFPGIDWTDRRGRSMFDLLSRTLGEADYISVNTEVTEPNPLFAKFMDDMAGQVCLKAVNADLRQMDNTQRMVMVHQEDVDQNLRHLRLKMHGIYVGDSSMEGLNDLRTLYDEVLASTNQTRQAWFAVCVAMLTAPEFMAY